MRPDWVHHAETLQQLKGYVGDIILHTGWNYNGDDSICITWDDDHWVMNVWNNQRVEEVQKKLKKFYHLDGGDK